MTAVAAPPGNHIAKSRDLATRTTKNAGDWYRLGDGYLCLQSEYLPFRAGFERLFVGCREVSPDDAHLPVVRCEVRTPAPGDFSEIRFVDPAALDVVRFAVTLFADKGCREIQIPSSTRRAFGVSADGRDVVLAESGDAWLADNLQPWEWLVGNICVHRVLRLQPDVVAFHAASVAIRGNGVLLLGRKSSGKTTLSLTLASRGHGFLGDELAALRLESLELLPVRRTTSIRIGVRSARVGDALDAAGIAPERFPDGAVRVRARIDQLFPANTAAPVRLSAIVFLRGLGTTPRLEPFTPRHEHLKGLTPLQSTLWNVPPAERAIRLLRILPKARCYWLDVGEPEATADLLENTVNTVWD